MEIPPFSPLNKGGWGGLKKAVETTQGPLRAPPLCEPIKCAEPRLLPRLCGLPCDPIDLNPLVGVLKPVGMGFRYFNASLRNKFRTVVSGLGLIVQSDATNDFGAGMAQKKRWKPLKGFYGNRRSTNIIRMPCPIPNKSE